MIGDACSKYFYILAMSLKLQPGGNLVRVAPSKVHGLGVFAARDIRKHICFTAYPIDLLALYEEGSEPGPRPLAVFSRQHRNSEAEAHKRLKKQLITVWTSRPALKSTPILRRTRRATAGI